MEIRDNVRRRRQARISQLLGQGPPAPERQGAERLAGGGQPMEPFRAGQPDPVAIPDDAPGAEPDPELWWNELQRQRRSEKPAWSSAGGFARSPNPPRPPVLRQGYAASFVKGLIARVAVAAILYGAAWGWFTSALPGSEEAKIWLSKAVTQEMDVEAARAWYERTFGGSPAFLPIFRSRGETAAVSGRWSRRDAVLPVQGRVVQTFAQDGGGVRIAAGGGSTVNAVYAGRVLQVASEDGGKTTVLVQHAGRIMSVYGNLERLAVRPNDWVEAGQRLGSMAAAPGTQAESLLFFAVKRDGKTIDPAEVVPFD